MTDWLRDALGAGSGPSVLGIRRARLERPALVESGLSALERLVGKAAVEDDDHWCHSKRMHTSPAIDAARQFLAVVWDDPVPTDSALTGALDRLIAAYHVTVDAEPSDGDLEAPRDGGPDLFQRIGARFPDYGLYPLADPTDGPDAKLGWGDAIDDLGDLTLDMREVVWLADNTGADDAHWSFRLHFFHWGTHARDLSRYLHGRQFG